MARRQAHGAARVWARQELRRRWVALVVLGLLAGVAAGLAMAAVAGARRADTAWSRLRDRTDASDAIIFTSQAGIFDEAELDYARFESLPYVADVGAFGIVWGVTDLEVGDFGAFVTSHGGWLRDLDRPRIVEGRLPHPDDPHEVVLSRPEPGGEVDALGLGVGDTVTAALFTVEQQAAGRYDGPEGPTIDFEIVGIGDSPFDVAAIPSVGDIFAGPAFLETYGRTLTGFSNATVRLVDPERDIRRLEAEVARAYPGRDVPVLDVSAAAKRVTNGTDLERSGLALLAAAVALAGIVIVGQALTRSVRAAAEDVPTLVAIGFSRFDAARALALSHLLAIAVAGGTAAALAVALSPRFPIGLSRRMDPDIGLHADLVVLVPGTLALLTLLVAAVGTTAWRMTRPGSWRGADQRSRLAGALWRAGAPVVVTTGARYALEPGTGSRSLPTRSAVAGAVTGALGVIGAVTLGAGIGDAVEHPERFGTVWDVSVGFAGDGPLASFTELPATLAADDQVTDVARLARLPVAMGDLSLPAYAIESVEGTIDFVVLDGRAPHRSGEVVLGPDTAAALGAGVGDEVPFGSGPALTVVGLGLFPTGAHSSFDQGAWVGHDDLVAALSPDRIADLATAFEGAPGAPAEIAAEELPFLFGAVVARLVDGADPAAMVDSLRESGPGLYVETAATPADQKNLQNVRGLPVLFGVFAGALAVGALAHVSASVVRRRGRDLAIMRAIGWTPGQARWCVTWQAIVLALLGLVVGVPLGVAAGRWAWQSVAEAIPMVVVSPVAAVPLLLVLPVALVLANLLAAWPGRRAAALRPAEVLRTE